MFLRIKDSPYVCYILGYIQDFLGCTSLGLLGCELYIEKKYISIR